MEFYFELFVVAVFIILAILNLILFRKSHGILRGILSFLAALVYVPFKLIPVLEPYTTYYLMASLLAIFALGLFMIPKKVTKNITEYDYFELEKSYYELKDDKEKLRQRFLSTISLIDEGMVFYENGNRDVILSDFAHEVFGGPQTLSLEDHASSIVPADRQEYLSAINNASKKNLTYDIKYRVDKSGDKMWVEERGNFIGVDNKKSIIAIIKPLEIKLYKTTSYFDIDSLYGEEKMYVVLKNLITSKKSFSFIYFELSNIPDINDRYSREVGSLMMNDYIKYMKNRYQRDINKFYRISGIRFIMLIDEYRDYEEFHRDLVNGQSEIYNTRIQISGMKDAIKPNFGIVNLNGNKQVDSIELYKLASRLLDEAIESPRRSYSIFGE